MKATSLIALSFAALMLLNCKKHECEDETPVTKTEIIAITTDAQVSNFTGTSNHANAPYISPKAWTNGSPFLERALININLSSIPSGATINKATLHLYADTVINYSGGAAYGHSKLSGSNASVLKRITSSWSESTVTWNTQPTTDAVNKVELAASTSKGQNYNIDVLQLVKDQYASPSTYHGFMIQLNTEEHYRSLMFHSSNGGSVHMRPTLEVEYTK